MKPEKWEKCEIHRCEFPERDSWGDLRQCPFCKLADRERKRKEQRERE